MENTEDIFDLDKNEQVNYVFSIGSKDIILYSVPWSKDTKLCDEISEFIDFRDAMYLDEHRQIFGDIFIRNVSAFYLPKGEKIVLERLDNLSLFGPMEFDFNRRIPSYLIYLDRLKFFHELKKCIVEDKYGSVTNSVNEIYPVEEFMENVPIAGILKILFSDYHRYLIK
ncbi:MAG: hypothetical protein QXI33_03030 [Candidatus Pacearchaeota archaeon]